MRYIFHKYQTLTRTTFLRQLHEVEHVFYHVSSVTDDNLQYYMQFEHFK